MPLTDGAAAGKHLDVASSFAAWLDLMRGQLTLPRAAFWWPTLLVAALGAAVFLLHRKFRSPASWRPFLRELPVDIACFAGYTYTQILLGPVLFGATVAGTAAIFVVTGLPQAGASPGFAEQIFVAAMAFIFGDLALYWSHRLFHRFGPLWWLHSLHHRPAVLTPMTAFRFWPPEAACHFVAFNLGEGIALGLCAKFVNATVTPATYAGLNIFLLAWYIGFSHLRHSHFPLYFPRWLSYVLVSPLMHQVHHSREPRHHHRNFGTALALWDWIFRTLYVPPRDERFSFGIPSGAQAAR